MSAPVSSASARADLGVPGPRVVPEADVRPGLAAEGEPATGPGTGTAVLERPAEATVPARPWNVVVWNDPVNLMSYVAYVFRAHFGYSAAKARRLMLEVHERGRSVVFTGAREAVETHVGAMHGFGLWATLEQAED